MEIDPFSILVLNREGELLRKKCPFKVICIRDAGLLSSGEVVLVIKVAESDGMLVFLIQNTYYIHSLFSIL